MQRILSSMLFPLVLLSFLTFLPCSGQETETLSQDLLDMKLELLNSKIELFNSQILLWETKPLELEQRLMAVNKRIEQLEFDPVYFNNKLYEIELLIEEYNAVLAKDTEVKKAKKGLRSLLPDSVITVAPKTAISLNPLRLYEGTFQVSYERAVSPKLAMEVSALTTYATEEGISGFYMSNQDLMYYNAALSSMMPYHNNNISGYGLELKLKNYLLTDHYRKQRAPVGLYASAGLMFRRLWLSGISEYTLEDEW